MSGNGNGKVMGPITATGKGPGTGTLMETVRKLYTHRHSEIKRLGNMRFPFYFFYISPDLATATRGRAPLVKLYALKTSGSLLTSQNFVCCVVE
jgi:hypothetical protein